MGRDGSREIRMADAGRPEVTVGEGRPRNNRGLALANAVVGGVGVGGLGATVVSVAADGPWWTTAPAAVIGVISVVLAVVGRTAATVHGIRRLGFLGRHEDRLVSHVGWLTAQLENQDLSTKKRIGYQAELDRAHRMLVDLRR